MSDDYQKYRMFRNYMANELNIGKEEIRAWTQAAIEREVEKKSLFAIRPTVHQQMSAPS